MKAPDLRDTTNKFMVSDAGLGIQMIPSYNRITIEDALNLAAWLYVKASASYENQDATDDAFSAFVERIRNV